MDCKVLYTVQLLLIEFVLWAKYFLFPMGFKFRKLSFKFHIWKTSSTNRSLTGSISCAVHYRSGLLFDKKFRIYLTCCKYYSNRNSQNTYKALCDETAHCPPSTNGLCTVKQNRVALSSALCSNPLASKSHYSLDRKNRNLQNSSAPCTMQCPPDRCAIVDEVLFPYYCVYFSSKINLQGVIHIYVGIKVFDQ